MFLTTFLILEPIVEGLPTWALGGREGGIALGVIGKGFEELVGTGDAGVDQVGRLEDRE